jgi:hypothetical protein
MPVKHALLVSIAAIVLTGLTTMASAQFFDRQRQGQPSHNSIFVPTFDARTRAAPPVPPVQRVKLDDAGAAAMAQQQREPVRAAPPARIERPLTEEELAAKAAVDALFEREPSLAKARGMPDPALIREAVRRHAERDVRIAAEQARHAAEEAKRREAEEKNKARQARPATAKVQREMASKPVATPPAQAVNRPQPSAPAVRTVQHKPAVQHNPAAQPRPAVQQQQPSRKHAGPSITVRPF